MTQSVLEIGMLGKNVEARTGSHKLVNVTFDEDQMKIIRSLKGFGTEDAEIVRSIVIAYLSEHNYIKQASIDRDRSNDESDRKFKLARAGGNF
ncbi:MAG TPA: hypothetical protein VJ439_03080 [Candidatus Bathyarchaeia archaeon]|nr:hypothetical protein [Candidatus Bathyarchaeia archaeon]